MRKKGRSENVSFKSFYDNKHTLFSSDFSLVGAKVIIDKSHGEVSLLEQDTIENGS